ncbi:hypothetical protein EBME_2153 [bacterium endosymbiont of Mortierella elongata FMR23-6]|nr:hypothetical protein EBME_2153 [bacterium endosymbiont of Mortierella elongata FMR23-6]
MALGFNTNAARADASIFDFVDFAADLGLFLSFTLTFFVIPPPMI